MPPNLLKLLLSVINNTSCIFKYNQSWYKMGYFIKLYRFLVIKIAYYVSKYIYFTLNPPVPLEQSQE